MKTPKRQHITPMHWLAVLVVAFVVSACASIGRPEGGPRDVTPPVFVSSNPPIGATNANRQIIDLYFNENVQLDDPTKKIVVSPAQKEQQRVTANGKHVRVELKDTLLPNTTYTIDFADAIKDLNEGNILDGFATYFSTGENIDTLSISGIVLEARTLEPAQGMLVGVYSNTSDTAIYTLPLERIARTNQYGQFSVLNLKAGEYRIYALEDMDGRKIWDPSENVAFYDVTITPHAEAITVTDTLRSSINEDSLVNRQGTAFYPNDVLLTWFNEGKPDKGLDKYDRNERNRININLRAPADSLPEITIAKGEFEGLPIDSWALLQKSATLDTLQYWITDTTIMKIDSLYLSLKYVNTQRRTDSITKRVTAFDTIKTDTLKFFFKDPVVKKKKKKEQEAADTLPPPPKYVSIKPVTSSTHEVYMPVVFSGDQPIDSLAEDLVHLQLLQDTLWVDVPKYTIAVDSLNPLLNRRLFADWLPGEKYKVTIDSGAVKGVYGEVNKAFKHEFTVKPLEEYSNLVFNISGTDSAMIVELLDKADKVLRTAPVIDGVASFKYLAPGTVYARLYIDGNRNGKWDTGDLKGGIQPEEVYYYPKKINLKKNWDVNNTWDIYEIPLDMQKPYDIKKNKPKLKKGEKAPSEEEEEEDEYDVNFYGSPNNAYSNARRNSSQNPNNGFGNSNQRRR